jgi:glycerol-3-phosphate dehydrogenase
MNPPTPIHDVAVVGAGVVGCAIARELSRFGLNVVIVDAADDVGTGTSKANSAILHTGFDAPVGTLEASLVRRGHSLLSKYASENDIPIKHVGALVLAWSSEDLEQLRAIEAKARDNSYVGARRRSAEEVYAVEPHLARGLIGALEIPDEAVVCPFTTPLAFATEAVLNGAELILNTPVTSIETSQEGWWTIRGGHSAISARWLVNAAGLYADEIEAMIAPTQVRITPRRGQFVIFDKHASSMVSSILLGVPTPRTKGILVAPTVFGNVLLGPTAEDIDDKTDTRTTHAGISHLLAEGERIIPGINDFEITSTYAGLRAVGPSGYQVDADGSTRYAWAYGIRSTGLTSSMAIAEHLLDRMSDAGLEIDSGSLQETVSPPLGLNYLGDDRPRPHVEDAHIASDPGAGKLMCFCEGVSLADLESAVNSVIPPRCLEGLWRRTRAMGGRCQGFYCRGSINEWFDQNSNTTGPGR